MHPRAGAGDLSLILDDLEVARRAGEIAAALREQGIADGDVVAVRAGNGPPFVAARDALAALGAVMAPVHPKLTEREQEHVVRASGARLLLDEERLAALHARGPSVGPGMGATILFTSGTTGAPKACLRSEAAEAARADELCATYGLGRDDVHLVACPLAHSAPGIFLRAARRAGARTAILPRFEAQGFAAAVNQTRATLCFLVPTQVERLLALSDIPDMPSLRAVVVAGAPFAPALRRRFLELLGPERLWEFYGASETGTISVLPPAAQELALERPGLVGWPAPTVELRVGEANELFVRSPTLMERYLGEDPGAWYDGFLSVGDVARLDADGGVVLVDRRHDTIITGGVNVYPAEVERALAEHPGILAAVVCGVPDAEWGERVVALAAARGTPPADDALRAFLRERLAPFKIPKRFVWVAHDELPLGGSGKPLRRLARERLA